MNRLKSDPMFKKQLFALAIPFAMQTFLTSLVGASDALMLGRLTQEAIAAVSLANNIAFVMSLFNGAVVGAVGVLAAQYFGKGDKDMVKKLLSMAIRYSFVIAAIFFALAFFIPDKLMMIFTNEPELIRIGAGYLKIVSFSYFFNCMSQGYLMLMKMDGRAKMSVWISAMTVVVDMTVDFFLIYGIGRIPALGANGSAYSTIVVEFAAFVWCVIASYAPDKIHPDGKSLRFFSKVIEKDMLKVAFPMLGSGLAWGLSIAAHSAIMGRLGTDAAAAFSVINVATSLMNCLSHGFANGLGIMIGEKLGQNDLEKAKEYGHRSWVVTIFIAFINVALIAGVGALVYVFYVLEPLAKSYLVKMILFNLLYMFAYAFNTVFTCGVFPAGGDANYDAISVFFATWCFALPLAAVGCFLFKWPVMIVYIVMKSDEIVKVPFIIPRYKKYIWLKNLTRSEDEVTG